MKSFTMKSGVRLFAPLLILSLAFASLMTVRSYADTPEQEAAKKQAEAAKKLAEMQKKADENIDYKFDRFKGGTLIAPRNEKVMSQNPIFGTMGDLMFDPSATVPGEVAKTGYPAAPPDTVTLLFWAEAQRGNMLKYSQSNELDILVNGKPLGPYTITYKAGRYLDHWLENMTVDIPFKDFQKIATADKVEGRLGTVEFTFNDYQTILYNTFLKRISPAAPTK